MTVRPCIDCGTPADDTRCPPCTTSRQQRDGRRRGGATARGYTSRWQRLARRAIRRQPWCTDCGTRDDLTGDHLVWPATKLEHVDVVCRGCNSRRGARRSLTGGDQPVEPTSQTRGSARLRVTPKEAQQW